MPLASTGRNWKIQIKTRFLYVIGSGVSELEIEVRYYLGLFLVVITYFTIGLGTRIRSYQNWST